MADPFVALGLNAIPYATNNYHRVYHPVKERVRKMRGRNDVAEYQNSYGDWVPDDRGLVLKKRSEVQSDEEIVEQAPRRNLQRQQLVRRTSSMDRGDYDYDRRNGRNDRRVGAWRGGDASDSEGSVPPRSRVSGRSRGRAKSTTGRSQRNRSSSSSSSDLGSSTDDEKKCKSIARKKWITGSLAAVATVHAAAKVYSSIENHDKRVAQVIKGEISPEEASKKKKQAHWQDAAAIAVAALGIKSALGEWNEVQEQRKEHKELLESREERHKKRVEHERKKARERANRERGYTGGGGGGGYDSDPGDRRR